MSLLKHLLRYTYGSHHHRGHGYGEHNDVHGSYPQHGYSRSEGISTVPSFLKKFSRGGKMLLWVLAGFTAFMALALVGLVAALIPLLSQAFDYLNSNGIKGAADVLTGLLQRLWEGAGK
jgi:hypothetical protein